VIDLALRVLSCLQRTHRGVRLAVCLFIIGGCAVFAQETSQAPLSPHVRVRIELAQGPEFEGDLLQYVGGRFRVQVTPTLQREIEDVYVKRIVILPTSAEESIGPEDPGPYRVEPAEEETPEPAPSPTNAAPASPIHASHPSPEKELSRMIDDLVERDPHLPKDLGSLVSASKEMVVLSRVLRNPSEPLSSIEAAYRGKRLSAEAFFALKSLVYWRMNQKEQAERMANFFKERSPENAAGYDALEKVIQKETRLPRGKWRPLRPIPLGRP